MKITESPYFIPSLSASIALACVFVIGISSFLLYVFCYKRRSNDSEEETDDESAKQPRTELNGVQMN